MKKIINVVALLFFSAVVFSQNKLRDGIYLVEDDAKNTTSAKFEKTDIRYNPYFVDEAPEEYDPVSIVTNDFVAFELTTLPFIQYQEPEGNLLIVHLTKGATEKLTEFTAKNMMNHIAVVVSGEVLAIYKVTQPIRSEIIKISKCNGNACSDVYAKLKDKVKN
ncbi:MAG: hypothetical protein ABUT20_12075 [Bacteroidota bacterium]